MSRSRLVRGMQEAAEGEGVLLAFLPLFFLGVGISMTWVGCCCGKVAIVRRNDIGPPRVQS